MSALISYLPRSWNGLHFFEADAFIAEPWFEQDTLPEFY